tara:strand:+ start:490 stop:1074 length:585 start_codon:yes stop_codon:yes gene_type:complete
MNFATTQTYNFFDEPYKIVDWANSLEFGRDKGIQTWPGERSRIVSDIDNKFFNFVCAKQLRHFYNLDEMQNISWKAAMQFQRIKPNDVMDKTGHIHRDIYSQLTTIVYLTPNCNKSGTSIYKVNKPGHTEAKDTDGEYEEVAKFNSLFNSCIMFDGSRPHGANFDFDGERLTLITFFETITAPRFPIPDSNKMI